MQTLEKTTEISKETSGTESGIGKEYAKYDLLQIKPVKSLMKKRWYQPLLMGINLVAFALVIFTALFGTSVGNSNFSIIFVWIVWWSLLIMFLVPIMGRYWCTICPIPALGEWFQRGKPVSKTAGKEKLNGRQKKWPKKLSNMWPATIGFLLVATFSGLLTTKPKATAYMLIGLIAVSLVTSMFFKKRTFCRYLCPIGGFIGLYSQASALEVRVKDPEVCKNHRPKNCIVGTDNSYGCPWMEYPGKLEKNTYCGLCMECLKACDQDNIALNVRSFGHDITHASNYRMDEAFKAQVMLGASLLYSTVLLGPYGTLKSWANFSDALGMLRYAAFFITSLLVVVPAFFYLDAKIVAQQTKTETHLGENDIFKSYAYTTIPLGLMTWIGFSFLFLFPNWAYIINVVNDPFGWGWHLLGIHSLAWQPVFTRWVPFITSTFVLIGFILSLKLTQNVSQHLFGTNAKANFKGTIIHSIFLFIFTIGLLYSFAG